MGILYVYMNADRELFSFRLQNTEALTKTFEEAIDGIDLFRAFNRLGFLREDIQRNIYRVSVQNANFRFVTQAMTILCEFSGLIIIAAVGFFAIFSKFNTDASTLAVIGTAISFSLRMTLTFVFVVRDSTRLDNFMKRCTVLED